MLIAQIMFSSFCLSNSLEPSKLNKLTMIEKKPAHCLNHDEKKRKQTEREGQPSATLLPRAAV